MALTYDLAESQATRRRILRELESAADGSRAAFAGIIRYTALLLEETRHLMAIRRGHVAAARRRQNLHALVAKIFDRKANSRLRAASSSPATAPRRHGRQSPRKKATPRRAR